MSDFSSDPLLDAHLRDVPLPEGLADRLKQALVPTDEAIDERLREVFVPRRLVSRLHEVPNDVSLDEQITAVEPAQGLIARLRGVARSYPAPRKASRARRGLEAAALAAIVAGGLAAAVLLTVSVVYPNRSNELEIAAPSGVIEAFTTVDVQLSEEIIACGPSVAPSDLYASRYATFSDDPLPIFTSIVPPDVSAPAQEQLPPVAEWLATVEHNTPLWSDVVLMRYGVLGAPTYADDQLPDLERPWPLTPRGTELPRVRGYDRMFYLKHRVSPPISPGANAALETLAVPLTTQTTSYDRVCRQIAQGRTPEPSEVRVEDFLAAIDYHFPPAPAGQLAIRTAAGPSVFGSSGTALLQVGVEAGRQANKQKRASHLVLAIDASASMGRAGRWHAVTSAITQLLGQLEGDQRLSLVLFQEELLGRWEEVGPDQAAEILRELSTIHPRGGTDLAAGLQQAVSAALTQPHGPSADNRLVLITDSPTALPGEVEDRIREMLVAAGKAGMRLDVVDMSDREQPDSLLEELTTQLHGDYRRIDQAGPLYWKLLERLNGQSSVVASDARLTIRFNPKAVAAYRLIGHEANALADVTPPAVAAELHAGETATALVEIWFKNNDLDDVAQAELTWTDPASHQTRKLQQRISRLQFAPTFVEAAPSLQAAAIAAETAEQLRGSRDALREVNLVPAASGWDALVAVARDANPTLDQWRDYQQLIELVDQLRSRRSALK